MAIKSPPAEATEFNGEGYRATAAEHVPIASELQLRHAEWIAANRRKVDQLSGGKLAYVYLPDTGQGGLTNFNRYYYAQSYQFMQGGPDTDLGAVIFDVTGLPDPKTVKVVARIRYPQSPGGFHNTFAYKHSDGRVLYFATINQSKALIYDLSKVVSGAPETSWLIGEVANPTPTISTWLSSTPTLS